MGAEDFNLLADIGDIRNDLRKLDHDKFNGELWRSILKNFFGVVQIVERISGIQIENLVSGYAPLKQVSESQSTSDYLLKYQLSQLTFSFTNFKYSLYKLTDHVVKQSVEDIIKDIHQQLNLFVEDARIKSDRYKAMHLRVEPEAMQESLMEMKAN